MSDTDEVENSAAPLIEHLAELRRRVLYCIYSLLAAVLFVFFFADPMLDFLVRPLAKILVEYGQESTLIFTAPQEKFFAFFASRSLVASCSHFLSLLFKCGGL